MRTYIQRTTATSGTVNIIDRGDDVNVIHETGSLVLTLTIALPDNPIDGQMVTFSSVFGVTALTLTAVIGTIINTLTTIASGTPVRYIYSAANDKWYKT